jgi:cell division protein FtsI (penicillin-binding protein 3)
VTATRGGGRRPTSRRAPEGRRPGSPGASSRPPSARPADRRRPAPRSRPAGQRRPPGGTGGVGTPARRCLGLLIVLALAFSVVALRLGQLQVVASDDYAARGVAQRLREITLPGERGAIFDRNHHELAMSVRQHTVWANPRLIEDRDAAVAAAARLAPVLGVDEAVIADRLSGDGAFVYLARQVDDETAAAVEALEIEAVALLDEPKRFKPAGDLGLSLIGDVDIDGQGVGGLEMLHQGQLVGTPGSLLVERGPGGRTIAAGEQHLTPAERGDDLVLTIDRALQHEVERALGAQIEATGAAGGTAVVMNPNTGEILAMANLVSGGEDQPAVPSRHNKAVTDVYEPGSVMKLVAAAAVLEEDVREPGDTWTVPRSVRVSTKTFSDEHPSDEPSSVGDIITRSSNVGTIMLAQDLGEERLHSYFRRFGFGRSTGLGFPNESAGIVHPVEDWDSVSIGTMSIGQGISVTALQMLGAYNVIANGGELVEPTLVKATLDADGNEQPVEPAARERVLSEETAREMRGILTEVVASEEGTGQKAQIAGYSVAGKTGTPRKPSAEHRGYEPGAYMPTFAGFVPAEDPQLSAVVMLDKPQPYYASLTAAPVFAEIMQYSLRQMRIPPAAGAPLAEVPVTTIPDDAFVPRD